MCNKNKKTTQVNKKNVKKNMVYGELKNSWEKNSLELSEALF